MRVFLIILDSVGIGAAPDAAAYGDSGANTLGNTAKAVKDLSLPGASGHKRGLCLENLQQLGLGNIPALLPGSAPIAGVPPAETPGADFGAMREISAGKDTTTGHWEIAGLHLKDPFRIFPPGPPSFPAELIGAFEQQTGRKVIGNKAASGTAIIDELGPRQIQTGEWIVYTSADSVFQIAAHEEVIPIAELYRACEIARVLCNPLRVGRVIARPYIGSPGQFQRTTRRRDFSMPPPEPFVMEHLTQAGVPVYMVGKLDDIYAGRGMTASHHTGDNLSSQRVLMALAETPSSGLIMANLIDFDMLYGHRRDPRGYAAALMQTDLFLGALLKKLREDDRLIITADHGNDPTFHGTDHTREYVPLLIYSGAGQQGRNLGIRHGFFDIARTLTDWFGLPPWPRGVSCVFTTNSHNQAH